MPPSDSHAATPKVLHVVIPFYNEMETLDRLFKRLFTVEKKLADLPAPVELRYVLVDDRSTDGTFETLKCYSEQFPNIRVLRLAKNSGSHTALMAGFSKCDGDAVMFMAADLQDPPEMIFDLVEQWRKGTKIVWAARNKVQGDKRRDRFFSRLFWKLVRHFTDIRLPKGGVDFVLIDAIVLETIRSQLHRSVPLHFLIAETGFESAVIHYNKPSREEGTSRWTLKRKLMLVIETFTFFSYSPVRAMSVLGLSVSVIGLALASLIVVKSLLFGTAVAGWASLMVTVLFIGGVQILMLGVLGEYLCRVLKETRNVPRFVIEDDVESSNSLASNSSGLNSPASVSVDP